MYNTPETPNPSHAGVLLALGLQGHLRILAATDVYRYLAQEHDVTTVGVLLGMAAAHHGTLNPVISKMLYLHIPARHPPSFPELELPPLVQSAALMAVGLLYQGSAHRLTTEILLAGEGGFGLGFGFEFGFGIGFGEKGIEFEFCVWMWFWSGFGFGLRT
jgi:anaphase-promoting complex subunit 1